jgi:hypothetical protein
LTVRVLGAVERAAGVLEGFARVAGREVSFGEGEADVDGVFSEAASVREEDAAVGFGDSLGVIAEMRVEFGGRVCAAELELDVSGAVGEGAGVLKVLSGFGGFVSEDKKGQKGIGAAESVAIVIAKAPLSVGLGLADGSRLVAAKEL